MGFLNGFDLPPLFLSNPPPVPLYRLAQGML